MGRRLKFVCPIIGVCRVSLLANQLVRPGEITGRAHCGAQITGSGAHLRTCWSDSIGRARRPIFCRLQASVSRGAAGPVLIRGRPAQTGAVEFAPWRKGLSGTWGPGGESRRCRIVGNNMVCQRAMKGMIVSGPCQTPTLPAVSGYLSTVLASLRRRWPRTICSRDPDQIIPERPAVLPVITGNWFAQRNCRRRKPAGRGPLSCAAGCFTVDMLK